MSSNRNIENWLAFLRTPNVGPAAFHKHLQQDPSLEQLPAWANPNWAEVEQDISWSLKPGNHLVIFNDDAYPPLLKEISRPPPILFVKGDLKALSQPQIAMVGSRSPTHNGLSLGYEFARQFAEAGLAITSGLALGVDAAAHLGALSIDNAKTIAILAHGLDTIYPRKHQGLAQRVVANGALVTEFPLGVKAKAQLFPQRNRIISGLSVGTLVVEAAKESGSLITAKFALEQGREVFSLPGSVLNSKARGCNELIQQGAKLVLSPKDVFEEIGLQFNFLAKQVAILTNDKEEQKQVQFVPGCLAKEDITLLSYINREPISVDSLSTRSGYSVAKIGGMLLALELKGYISLVQGGYILSSAKFN